MKKTGMMLSELRAMIRLILTEAACPECGHKDAYIGLNDVECVNKLCKNYSPKQLMNVMDRVYGWDKPVGKGSSSSKMKIVKIEEGPTSESGSEEMEDLILRLRSEGVDANQSDGYRGPGTAIDLVVTPENKHMIKKILIDFGYPKFSDVIYDNFRNEWWDDQDPSTS